jgi:hypothetical protein
MKMEIFNRLGKLLTFIVIKFLLNIYMFLENACVRVLYSLAIISIYLSPNMKYILGEESGKCFSVQM